MSLPTTTTGYALQPDEGEAMWFNGALAIVKASAEQTDGRYGAVEFRGHNGFAAPLHTHTNDMKVVIVSGTFIQTPEGKPEFRLGPGSYFLQPGGNYRHTTSCDPAAECVFFVEGKGKFDLKLVQPPATAPAKP